MNKLHLSAALLVFICLLAVDATPRNRIRKVFKDNFNHGAAAWEPTDISAWKIVNGPRGAVYSQHKKRSAYEPPHRSPLNISLVRDLEVTDFELTVRVLSTHEDYGHRDACLFFGYQDNAHFYYVHLGKQADDHANQVFIVDGAARTKISETTTAGTDWDDKWHTVRVTRNAESGSIAVYFDDMETPVMTATDKTFAWGRVGVGSFDDTADWDDVRLRAAVRTE